MRLGTSSPLKHDSPEEWAENHVKLGLRCVNFPLNCNDPEDKIIAYRDAAKASDLLIAEVGIWRNALAADSAERRKNMDYCIGQLRLADFLGARCAVNVAGAFGPRWDGHYKENFSETAWKETVRMVQEIIDAADVKNTYFSAGRYFNPEEFIDEVTWKLGNKIRSCHIKDVHLKEEYTFQLEECAPGKGEFPLRYYAQKMSSIDPDMPVILEHLNTDEEYIKYTGYLKEVLDGIQ